MWLSQKFYEAFEDPDPFPVYALPYREHQPVLPLCKPSLRRLFRVLGEHLSPLLQGNGRFLISTQHFFSYHIGCQCHFSVLIQVLAQTSLGLSLGQRSLLETPKDYCQQIHSLACVGEASRIHMLL